MDKILSIVNNGRLGAKSRIGMCQTTMAWCNKHNTSRAQIIGVGENPLNRNGLPLTGNAEGEEIV